MSEPSYRDSVAAIPAGRRPWSMPWPEYAPVDITPPELQPAGLPASVAEGWAEGWATPHDVPDWPARQAAAVVPFDLDDAGRPLHPEGRTGRSGRNLGKWGENAAADPIVVSRGQVLLIRRSDNGEWAIPGGMVDPGETAVEALVREAGEETGIDLTGYPCTVLARTLVQDWRTTDHAWVATTAALVQLDDVLDPTAGDDATAARWWPFTSLAGLADALRAAGAELSPGHWPLLAAALDTLTTPAAPAAGLT